MKNGWYKLEYKDNKWTDFWPPNDEIVFVENGVITETKDEWGKYVRDIKMIVTDEMKKHMAIMEFGK